MVGEIIGGALGLAELGIGLSNQKKDEAERKQLMANRPVAKPSEALKKETQLAESELGQGMSERSERAYKEASDAQFASSLGAILKGGGSANNVGDVFGKSQEGLRNLTMMQENLRLNQIQSVIQSYDKNTEEQRSLFEFNEWRPWADNMQSNAARLQKDADMQQSGLNTFGGAFMGAAHGAEDKSAYDKYFNAGVTKGQQSQQDNTDNNVSQRYSQEQTVSMPKTSFNINDIPNATIR